MAWIGTTTQYYSDLINNPTTNNVGANVLNIKQGYLNELYYPHSSVTNEIYGGCYFYRLAATAGAGDFGVVCVCNDGYIGFAAYDNKNGALRPVVRLKASTTITTGTNGYDYNLVDNSI